MNRLTLLCTLASPNASYFGTVSGINWVLTNFSAPDTVESSNGTTYPMAHILNVTNNTATDYSADTLTITGFDANNQLVSETLNLPGSSATVNTVRYWRTIISMIPSVATGSMSIGFTNQAAAPAIGIDIVKTKRDITLQTTIFSGSVTWTVQDTMGDLLFCERHLQFNTPFEPSWINSDDPDMVAQTGNSQSAYYNAPVYVRHIMTYTAPSVIKFDVAQSRHS